MLKNDRKVLGCQTESVYIVVTGAENRGCTDIGLGAVLDTAMQDKAHKKRPNTIPVFGPGKWLLGESRALKVGINAG
ncbi:hypothetical protein [Enterobacter soli]|uniref:hypothetical protein n=1 Tax=Enterobacter soli TaxID=885040 RepID=UPI0034CE0AFE